MQQSIQQDLLPEAAQQELPQRGEAVQVLPVWQAVPRRGPLSGGDLFNFFVVGIRVTDPDPLPSSDPPHCPSGIMGVKAPALQTVCPVLGQSFCDTGYLPTLITFLIKIVTGTYCML